ncbi:mechanosensitive ion channel [Aureimonas altamirensis]|uniref:mechanosensitive ion channel family protein n=1 Tax=Aureimonas altamirensis TaxID=370622 RepID=UPI00203721CB|nr:mechanosensitive ion channel [Aureimonas altamirensis]
MKFLSTLLAAIAIAIAAPALAQTEAPPAATAEQPAAGVQSDLQALDRVIGLLNDPASRDALLQNLTALRATVAGGQPAQPAADGTTPAAAGAPAEPAVAPAAEAEAPQDPATAPILSEDGLLSAVTGSLADIGQNLPNAALGGPLDEKLANAGAQVRDRVLAGYGDGSLIAFFTRALIGWGVVAATILALFYLPPLRRARRLDHRPTHRRQLLMMAGKRLVLGLLPLVAGFCVLVLYSNFIDMPARQRQILAGMTIPVFVAVAVWQIGYCLLMLLGLSRGWHLVSYSQRRILKWVAAVAALGSISTVLADPPLRIVAGWDATDVARLVVDILLAVTALVFVIRHRITVQRLILKGRVAHDDSRATSIMDGAINAFGRFWHLLAIIFIVINVVARLAGGGGSFLMDASIALLIVAGGLLLATWLDNALARIAANRAGRSGTRDVIMGRYIELLRIIIQVVILAAVAFACLDVWHLDLKGWLLTDAGWTITRPILSIAFALLFSWFLWITLDGWIAGALAPTDKKGRAKHQSSRTKTLLPLVRNFLFIALTVITVIAVLANIGVNVAPLLAGAGVIGLAVGFGSQQLVQDVITGMFILFEDTIAIGDWVDTGDRAGTVEQLTIRTLRLRDGQGALHSIPFSSVKAIKNSSRGYGVYIVEFKVAYHSDLDQVIAIMREVGAEIAVDPQFQRNIIIPFELWGVDQFAPDGIIIKGAIRTKPLMQWGVGREFNRRLKKRMDEAEVSYAPSTITTTVLTRESESPAEVLELEPAESTRA